MSFGSFVAAARSGATITAAARVASSCGRYFAPTTKAIVRGPADSSVATRSTATAPSPSSVAPTRDASSDRSMARASGPIGLLVGERLDHLLGDVDLLARVDDGVLDDQVELLGLGDLLDHLVGSLLDARELLVAPQVRVLAELALRALEVAREVGGVALAVAPLGLR